MKKFIIKLALFVFLLGIFLTGIDILSMIPPINGYCAKLTNSSTDRVGSAEIEQRIVWVQEENESTRLIVGDSVCNQLFIGLQGVNDDYCIASSNQAATMLGQYILINEYIKKHEQVEDIYLIIVPGTLASDINTRLSYQYFVMPFLGNGYGNYLDDDINKKLDETFGSFFLRTGIIKAIDYSCINRKIYLNLINSEVEAESENNRVADITSEYLIKIYELCKEKNIEFHLIPAPVADIPKRHEQIETLEREFNEAGLGELFPDYFEQICYYPEEEFGDETHFAGVYTEQRYYNQKIKDIIKANPDLDDLENVYIQN